MIYNPTPSIEQRLASMQERHAVEIHNSGILGRISMHTNEENVRIIETGFPLVLGSEADSVTWLMVGIRTSLPKKRTVSTKYFVIGQELENDILLPNPRFSMMDEDVSLIKRLFHEACNFRDAYAYNYSLESGILRQTPGENR